MPDLLPPRPSPPRLPSAGPSLNALQQPQPSGYTDAQDHGIIGNLRTCALVSISGTVAQLCLPHFDSPSVFARILDKDKGGHFSIRTVNATSTKQQYLPSTSASCSCFLSCEGSGGRRADAVRARADILATKFLSDEGVGQIDGAFPALSSVLEDLGCHFCRRATMARRASSRS